MSKKTYRGSCHCGAITFEAGIDLAKGTGKCNCTFCFKTRAWKAFTTPADFRILGGEDSAVGYSKHPQAPKKYFCRSCGVYTHELGHADYMGGDFVGIFLAALDDAAPAELVDAPVNISDGLHNNWQNPPEETRHL